MLSWMTLFSPDKLTSLLTFPLSPEVISETSETISEITTSLMPDASLCTAKALSPGSSTCSISGNGAAPETWQLTATQTSSCLVLALMCKELSYWHLHKLPSLTWHPPHWQAKWKYVLLLAYVPKPWPTLEKRLTDSRFSLLVLAKVCSPPYLKSFFIQHSVFALNLVSWPFLFSRVFCTSKNWTVLLQPFRGWVLGTGKYLQRNKEGLKNPNN